MKHLISKEHHPHLKKRAFLELFGLLTLFVLCISQKELIITAINDIRNSDLLYISLLMAMYWVLLPLTAISYRILANKKIPLGTTILSQLAGAGPGRIIPGGLGHISIASVHLHKVGLNLQNAIVVTVSNNLIGLITNLIIVTIAVFYHPNIISKMVEGVNLQGIIAFMIIVIAGISVFQWLSHVRKTRSTIKKLNNHWKKLLSFLIKKPYKLVNLMGIAILITLGHSTMIILSGEALGVHVNLVDSIIALSIGVLIGGIIPTPGGFGAVEAGIISALILLGYNSTEATSIALLFRTATYWQPLFPGIVAYMYLRERKLL